MDIEEFLISQKFSKNKHSPDDTTMYLRPDTILRFVLQDNSMYRIICNQVAVGVGMIYTFIYNIQNHYVPIGNIKYIEVLDCDPEKLLQEYDKLNKEVLY